MYSIIIFILNSIINMRCCLNTTYLTTTFKFEIVLAWCHMGLIKTHLTEFKLLFLTYKRLPKQR